MIDSVPIVMRRHFGANKELEVPLLGDLERLEVVHGPNALVHGGGAINGVINLITKRGRDHQGLQFKAEYGLIDESKILESSFGLSYGKQRDLFLYVGVLQAEGYEPNETDWSRNEINILRTMGAQIKARGYEPTLKASFNWQHDGAWLRANFFRILGSSNSVIAPIWFMGWFDNQVGDLGWYRALLSANSGYTKQLGLHNKLTVSATAQLHDYAIYRREELPNVNRFGGGGQENS